MNRTATQIANLSGEKRALLSNLLKNRHKVNAEVIPKLDRKKGWPLSFAQERMWFLAQLDPENTNYNVAGALRISGGLNIPLLEQCVNEVVRRQEALRTIFRVVDGQIEQIIINDIRLPLSMLDLSNLSVHDKDSEVDKLIKRELQKPFQLASGVPLLRMTLLQLNQEEFVLLLSMHHIASDEWSLRTLISEIGQLYQEFVKGVPSILPELAIQYADYASWQRLQLEGEIRDKQLEYWLNLLSGAPQVLDLPSDRPRPAIQTNRGAICSIVLPQDLSNGIIRFSRALDMTLFMTLMGAFSILLHRYTSMNDLCIGYPVTNRKKPEFEKLIGFFVNTLVMRSQLVGNPCVADYLTQVKRNLLDAQKHQDLPFEQLVEELNPERKIGHHPIFQVMFSYQNKPMDLPEISDLDFQLLKAENITAKFDLTLQITKTDSSIFCNFEYSTDIFEKETIVRMSEHFETLLAGMVSQNGIRISELPLLTQLERKQVLLDWNATTTIYPVAQSLHSLFEAQVEKTPDAVAVIFEEQLLTYIELNRKANQLAHFLCDRGVRPDVLVGVCLERSLKMVIGLLGVLKAGGAYVPLDPDYPQDRLNFMLQDLNAPMVLTQEVCRGKFVASKTTVFCLDSEWERVAEACDTNPGILLIPENLAYCIYTSGSTGQPKGACVPHQGILNRLQWMQGQYLLNHNDQILQKTPYSFDVSVWEFFWPLMTGAKLIIAKPDEHKDSVALIDTIIRQKITTIHFVPSMLQAFIDTQGVERCTSLKRVICSGEALSADLVVRFQQKIYAELHNLYGPTEASVDVSYWVCLPGSAETAIPIGRPIANISLYILDRYLNPVPIGIPGELHIGGIGLGRCYLNRPELTAEKFIPNPFQSSVGRLYKTGDLVRYRLDGNIDYLGRIDHQVKIRGFRIELGEIEARLLGHPKIKEAVVIAREDQPGNKRLVAYMVAATENDVEIETLKVYLKETLPDYMIPTVFVMLKSMPLSTNGKLNRKSLPQPDMSEIFEKHYVAPRTKTEKILASIWAEVLCMEKVGVEDDFFELGGHSLLAVQMSYIIQKKFNTQLSLKSFFEMPTVVAQARLIDVGESGETLVDLEAEAVLDPAIMPLPSELINVAETQSIFLTGATGFLGAFLLVELLKQTQADIYCLIRAANEQEAAERLKKQLSHYELLEKIDLKRIIPVCGDLSKPRLGLSEQRYQEIAIHVEVIYHNGALVNFIQPYQALKAANVLGTQEVLRLACTKKPKAIHYVSTLSVFSEKNADNPQGFAENDEPTLTSKLVNGYAKSKWVAEKLVRLARDRGFKVSIYRPGAIGGHSRSGVWTTDDFLCRLMKAYIDFQIAPEEDSYLNIVPVDFVSRAIITLSKQTISVGQSFHLNNPHDLSTSFIIDQLRSFGYVIKKIPFNQWINEISLAIKDSPEYPLFPLISVFEEQDSNQTITKKTILNCLWTSEILAKNNIIYIKNNESLIITYLLYLSRIEFIPKICKQEILYAD